MKRLAIIAVSVAVLFTASCGSSSPTATSGDDPPAKDKAPTTTSPRTSAPADKGGSKTTTTATAAESFPVVDPCSLLEPAEVDAMSKAFTGQGYQPEGPITSSQDAETLVPGRVSCTWAWPGESSDGGTSSGGQISVSVSQVTKQLQDMQKSMGLAIPCGTSGETVPGIGDGAAISADGDSGGVLSGRLCASVQHGGITPDPGGPARGQMEAALRSIASRLPKS